MFPVVSLGGGLIFILIFSCFPWIFYNGLMTLTISRNKALNITSQITMDRQSEELDLRPHLYFLQQTTSLRLRFINSKMGVLILTALKELLKELEG